MTSQPCEYNHRKPKCVSCIAKKTRQDVQDNVQFQNKLNAMRASRAEREGLSSAEVGLYSGRGY
jgi:hypothetical protein